MAVIIRPIQRKDMGQCFDIVEDHWGHDAACRFESEVWNDGKLHPLFYVAVDRADDMDVVGFAGMQQSWIMKGVIEFTWCNVRERARGQGIGQRLVRHRISVARDEYEAKLIMLMTTQPNYYAQWFKHAKSFGVWDLMTMQFGELSLET